MAIYSMHVSNVSRASGGSSLASLSYIASMRVRDERTGETFGGYGRRERVERTGVMLPHGAPREWEDAAKLFNAVEAAEKRVDARTAKKIMVALPREFDAEDRVRAVEDFVAVNLAAKGYPLAWAIHTDQQGNNPHAHILVANRLIDPKTGRWEPRRRTEYALDEDGNRVPVIDPKTGEQKTGARGRRMWKRVEVSNNPLDSKDFLEKLRADWAHQCNMMLPQGVRVDHRSLEDQAIDRIPTIHEGYAAREIERRGGISPLCEHNRRVRRLNALLGRLRGELGELKTRLAGLIAASRRAVRPPKLMGLTHAEPEPQERPVEPRKTPPPRVERPKTPKPAPQAVRPQTPPATATEPPRTETARGLIDIIMENFRRWPKPAAPKPAQEQRPATPKPAPKPAAKQEPPRKPAPEPAPQKPKAQERPAKPVRTAEQRPKAQEPAPKPAAKQEPPRKPEPAPVRRPAERAAAKPVRQATAERPRPQRPAATPKPAPEPAPQKAEQPRRTPAPQAVRPQTPPAKPEPAPKAEPPRKPAPAAEKEPRKTETEPKRIRTKADLNSRFKAKLSDKLEAERRREAERQERLEREREEREQQEQEMDGFGWDPSDPTNMSMGFGGGMGFSL
jgi:hypothetical protein